MMQGVVQVDGTRPDPRGVNFRLLSNALSKYHLDDNDSNAYCCWFPAPDLSGSVVFADAHPWTDGYKQTITIGLPPWPASDSINRSTFVPLTVQAGSVPIGTNNAVVQFGYSPTFYCTSRQEACVANGSGQVNETTPFYFASEAFTGIPCQSGCTITIPVLAQRVVYYRLQYRRADGSLVSSGPVQVGVTP
jgi:hypothetical protein